MTMRDPRIAQLRAKADSTTFPAEAAALRAKADELEARRRPEPAYTPPTGLRDGAASNWASAGRAAENRVMIRFEWAGTPGANFFEQMGGIVINGSPVERVQVTNVAGRTYWITVE